MSSTRKRNSGGSHLVTIILALVLALLATFFGRSRLGEEPERY